MAGRTMAVLGLAMMVGAVPVAARGHHGFHGHRGFGFHGGRMHCRHYKDHYGVRQRVCA